MMKTIKRGTVTKYAFDNRDKPCLVVAQDEPFQIETEDAFTGLIADDSDKPQIHRLANDAFVERMMKATPPLLNPVTGPIFIEGCEAGDVLAVKIDWIEPWRYGYTGIIPGAGPLHDSRRWPDCAEAHVHIIEHLPGPSGTTRDGKARYSDTLVWDLQPFIGTLAVAPEREVLTSLLGQGPWGGNMDIRDVCPGHTVLLNSYNKGGLLYIGDIHGSQGDTEFCILADETRATVQLSCTVLKGKRLPCVRIIKPESVVAVGINLPLEQAVYDACSNLMQWLEDEYRVKPKDTYFRMSADPAFRMRVYQMVRASTLQHVVGAEYSKDRLFPAF